MIPSTSQFWTTYGSWWPRCLHVDEVNGPCQMPALWSVTPRVVSEPRCQAHKGLRKHPIKEPETKGRMAV